MRSWFDALCLGRHRLAPRRSRKILSVEQLETRLTPVAGNFLVTNAQNLQVYDPNGNLLSSEVIPSPGDTPARDLIVDSTLAIHVFNGTQFPSLSSTIDEGENWTHVAGPAGWNTDTESETGGIAVINNFVFATDMTESGDGNGIIRWDLTDNSSARVVSGTDFVDLTIGLDGKLYALTPPGGDEQFLHVFDPFSLTQFPTTALKPKDGPDPNFTGIAVDADGLIYVVEFDTPDIFRFSPTGVQQRHRRLESGQLNNLLDIDISDDNRLLMGNDKGFVVRLKVSNFTGNNGSTLAKKNYKVFQILEEDGVNPSDGPTFVSWADPQEISLPHVTITGKKFEDLNANGVRNTGEPGLAGWTIFADFDESGTRDPAEPFAVTDELGNYTLDVNITAQPTFHLREEPQLGWAETFKPTATADEPAAAHPYYTLSFADGDQSNKNFGNHQTNFVVIVTEDLKTAENGFTATFSVVLTAPPTDDVTIPLSSLDPGEGDVSPASLTFTSDNWNVPQIVTVTGQPDGVLDGNVVYTIDLGPTVSSDPNYNGLSQSIAVTNFDSEPVDKVGIFRSKPRRWTLDAFNDGVYSVGLDPRYAGLGGGKTIVGDWNGDGYDDIGLFRGKTGTFVLFVDGNLVKTVTKLDGQTGGKPLVGDWDGVVGDELGLFRSGAFTLDTDNDGVANDPDDLVGGLLDGKTGGSPLVGDWDGDGREEVGLYRAKTGVFTLDFDMDLVSSDGDDKVINRLASQVGGRAVVGNWDNIGGDDVGLFFATTGRWLLDTNFNAVAAEINILKLDGKVGGKPVVGDFDGDGLTERGIFRPKPGRWTIDFNHNGIFDSGDLQYTKVDGSTGGAPLVGKWELPPP